MLSADLMFSGVTLSVVDFVHQWKEELFFFSRLRVAISVANSH
jgi:hypothetical protein